MLDQSGQADVAIVLRGGATDEMGSNLSLEQTRLVADTPGVKRDADGAIAAPELYVVVDVPLRTTGTAANVPLRGASPASGKLRPGFRIVEGRDLNPGRNEAITSRQMAERFQNLGLGEKLEINRVDFTIVGYFEAEGSAAESEVWTDLRDVCA